MIAIGITKRIDKSNGKVNMDMPQFNHRFPDILITPIEEARGSGSIRFSQADRTYYSYANKSRFRIFRLGPNYFFSLGEVRIPFNSTRHKYMYRDYAA
jgi:hypothetical protein